MMFIPTIMNHAAQLTSIRLSISISSLYLMLKSFFITILAGHSYQVVIMICLEPLW